MVKNERETLWKKVIVAYFEALSQHLTAGSHQNREEIGERAGVTCSQLHKPAPLHPSQLQHLGRLSLQSAPEGHSS
jgi:hypothetical protein